MFTCISLTVTNKTLTYKSIIAKISYKSLLKSLLNFIIYKTIFYSNLLSILPFIVDILHFFVIDLPYLILS